MNRSIIISLIVIFTATSCATLKKSVLQPDQLVLTKDNIKELDGTYKLDRIETDTLPRNIDDLSWILLVHGNTEGGDQIQLKWKEPNRLQVNLLKKGVPIETKFFKAKSKADILC